MKSAVPKVDKRISVKDSKTENIELYDSDNRYPQRIIDIINASVSATTSVELYCKFIIGGGFKDQLFYKSIINKKGLTADKLLRETARNISKLGGRAYHVNYNGLLQTEEVTPIPYEYCRIGCDKMAGMIAVYDDWECSASSRINIDKIKWYNRFTTDKVVTLAQINSVGGLLNFAGHIYTDPKYPLAPIDPAISAAISDHGIDTFTQKDIQNGFNPSAIIRYDKSFEGKENDQLWEDTLDTWKQFQSPENTGKLIVVSDAGEKKIQIDRLDTSNSDKMYDATGTRVKSTIRQRFKQPPSLLGVRDGNAVFSSQNIEDDTKYYNSVTTDERLLIEEDMKILFSNFHIKINETNDWSILELKFNAIATEKPSKISVLGVGGTQALMGVLQSSLADTQKINTIILVFGFTTEEAQSMVLPIATPIVS